MCSGSGLRRAEGCVAKRSKTNLETHALKASLNHSQKTTCTSSLLHARNNKINEMQTRHRSGCPEGARNLASRTTSLRFAGSFVTRRNHFAEPSSIRLFRVALKYVSNDLTNLRWLRKYLRCRGGRACLGPHSWAAGVDGVRTKGYLEGLADNDIHPLVRVTA